MQDPSSLREQARRCRALSKAVVEPEVIEQLRVWAVELAEEAEQAEWSAAEEEVSVLSILPIAPGVQRRDRDGAGFTYCPSRPPQRNSGRYP
jgi:hypothetical protein